MRRPLSLLAAALPLVAGGILREDSVVVAPTTAPALDRAGSSSDTIDFLKDVRPILAERCFACHGLDDPEADLRLDSREGATRDLGGYSAVVPGDLEESELWFRITTDEEADRMPPVDHDDPLTDGEKDILRRWIEEGAPWREHWAFEDWREPATPSVEDGEWIRDELDRFVLARLEKEGLTPAPEIDDLGWLRRAHFDLVGLPPTVEEQEAFLALPEDTRRAETVETLLDSPHFGERWARHLLDLVRYAETRGHEFDFRIPNAWEYRDYLVRALNADVGWDQMIREHIAGDLLPEPRRNPEQGFDESVLGTGFWFLGEAVHSPVHPHADLADRTANQIDVFGKAFLGLTIACARCHDHKFDPIPTTDYYALSGFLQSASYRQVRFESLAHNREIRDRLDRLDAGRELARDGLASWFEQAKERSLALREMLSDLRTRIAAAERDLRPAVLFADFEGADYEGWVAEGEAFGSAPMTLETKPRWYQKFEPSGQGFVNSHNGRKKPDSRQADALTGTLTSPSFEITHGVISFLMAGGNHSGKTELQLHIDGEIVHRATGRNSATYTERRWSVHEFLGKQARLVAIDKATGGWGHIAFDRIRFEDTVDLDALCVDIAGQDAAVLHAWHENERIPSAPQKLRIDGEAQLHWLAGRDWHNQDGSAFGFRKSGELLPSGDVGRPLAGIVPRELEYGAFVVDPGWTGLRHAKVSTDENTRLNWRGSGRTLRTTTFRIGEGSLWYLVRGRGVAFSVVEHHKVINGPLLTNTATRFDTKGAWRWIEHGAIRKAPGLRAHVEFSADPDQRDWMAVAAVAQGKGPPMLTPWDDPENLWVERPALLPTSVPVDPKLSDWQLRRAEILAERKLVSRVAPGLLDGDGVDQELLYRGDPHSPKDPVERRYLTRFGSRKPEDASVSGRLELAESMLRDSGPLIARVYVNRIWQHLFGEGLCGTSDNFGTLATYPTHPELIDALAADFRDGGFKLKPMLRRVVLSATYAQSGARSDTALGADPTNKLLHHRPVQRLSAEAVRDALLTVSGRLDRSVGGQPVPVHLTRGMTGRGRPGRNGPLDGGGRRTIYQEVRRNFLIPFLLVWDFPQPATTRGERSRSNVPAQSLSLMNDPFVLAQAKAFAASIASETKDESDQIRLAFRRAFARPPSDREMAASRALLADQDVQGLEDLCHALFQTKEFVHVR